VVAQVGERYDVVVVGAGIAGTLVSGRIAGAGHRVLMLDRRSADDLFSDSYDLVESQAFKVAGIDPANPDVTCPFSGLRVVSPDTATIVDVPTAPFLIINRGLLERELFSRARDAGVDVVMECTAGNAEISRGRVTGVSTDRGSFPCALAIGASGLDRSLCRDLPTGMGIPRRLRTTDYVSVYRERRDVSDDDGGGTTVPGLFEYHIGRFGGYSWTYATADGVIDIGTGVQDVAGSPDPREIVLGYVRSHGSVGEQVLSREGGRIPTRRPLNSMVAAGLTIVGDAACQASPVIGRGVAGALTGAALAADAAVKALSSGEASQAALWPYNYEYMRSRGAYMAALDCLRLLLQRLSGKDLSWSMAKGVIGAQEVAATLTGVFEVPRAQIRLKALWKGLKSVPLLARYDSTLKLSQKVLDHYMRYPDAYEAPEFAEWSQQADFLFEDMARRA
jgi:digeranylgeranylglycerophospholipid reductase